jgi:hypothetical protein
MKMTQRRLLSLAALAALTACTAQGAPQMDADQQASLDQVLSGYTAEPTVSCIESRNLQGNRSFGEGVILFEGPTRSTLYVNRPPAGCPELRPGRALQVRTTVSRLCRGDIVTVFDPVAGIQYGGCGLGDFTPYRRTQR